MNPFIKFIKSYTGMRVPDVNIKSIKDFIIERLNKLSISQYEYLNLLKKDGSELEDFIDVVAIGNTQFFREEKHFKLLKNIIINLTKQNKKLIKMWSSACSTGEEPISMAIVAQNILKGSQTDFIVYATDINSKSLKVLEKGEYSSSSIEKIGIQYYKTIMMQEVKNGIWKIPPELKNRIKIYRLNLYLDDLTQIPNDFDIVFLRNLLIYLEDSTKNFIISKVVEKISEGGYLFVSINEVPFIENEKLETLKENNTYFFRRKYGL